MHTSPRPKPQAEILRRTQKLSKMRRGKIFESGRISIKMKLGGSRSSKVYYFIHKNLEKIRMLQTNKAILRTAPYNSQIFRIGPLIKKLQLAV